MRYSMCRVSKARFGGIGCGVTCDLSAANTYQKNVVVLMYGEYVPKRCGGADVYGETSTKEIFQR